MNFKPKFPRRIRILNPFFTLTVFLFCDFIQDNRALCNVFQQDWWGNWIFEIDEIIPKNGSIGFLRGGFQEGRGGVMSQGKKQIGSYPQRFYIENIFQALDSPG